MFTMNLTCFTRYLACSRIQKIFSVVLKDLQEENKNLKKQLEQLQASKAGDMQKDLLQKSVEVEGINIITEKISIADSKAVKTLVFNLEKELDNGIVLIANINEGKVNLLLKINESLVESRSLDASVHDQKHWLKRSMEAEEDKNSLHQLVDRIPTVLTKPWLNYQN